MYNANTISKAIAKVDFNIDMFSDYRPTPYVIGQLKAMMKERQELIEYEVGIKEYEELSNEARNWMFEMPAWGYKGT